MNDQTGAEPKWYDRTWLVVVLLILFFPVGLYATWKNTHYRFRTKVIITGVVCLMLIIGFAQEQAVKSDIERADALWAGGSRGEAAHIYKDVLRANLSVVEQDHRPTVFQRVIEYDVAQGDTSAAKQMILKALDWNIPLAFQRPEAERLMSEVRAEIEMRAREKERKRSFDAGYKAAQGDINDIDAERFNNDPAYREGYKQAQQDFVKGIID